MQLRNYQEKFFDEVRRAYDERCNRQLGVMATGLGKAVCFAMLREQLGFERKVMVLVHREELAAQAARQFQHWNPHLMVGVEMADRSSTPMDQLIVGSVPTLGRRKSSRILKFHPDDFDAVISDECFPAGTLVDGIPIENIRAGDLVVSYDESSGRFTQNKVLRTFKNPAPSLMVRITSGDRSLICTTDHPVFTEKGWKYARLLSPGDGVLLNMRTSSRVPETFTGPEKDVPADGKGVLLQNLRQRGAFSKDGSDQSQVCLGENGKEKPDAQRCNKDSNARHDISNGASSESERRQWDRSDGGAMPDLRAIRRSEGGMGYGVWSAHAKAAWQWVSRRIQTGLGKSSVQGGVGSRWEIPQSSESEDSRQEERCVSFWSRVDDLEILKRNDLDAPDALCPDGFVYNLEVENTHTYFADGFLVHNCHHLSHGSQWANVLEYFGILRQNESRILSLGLTATPNRSDGNGLRDFYDRIVFSMSLWDGIESGYLVPLEPWLVKSKVNLDSVHTRAGDFAENELADAVNTPERNAAIVREWMKRCYGKRTLAFCVNIQHAADLAAMFRHYSIEAEPIWGTDPERASKFARHRSGKTTVLTNCQLAREGYDDRDIECVILAQPHKAALPVEQEIGRGTRLPTGIDNLFEAQKNGAILHKTKCFILSVQDITRKHKLFDLPTLFGLPNGIDIEGRSIVYAKKKYEQIAREFPTADLSEIKTLSKLESVSENLALFKPNYPPEIARMSELSWRKSTDGYMISVNKELVTVTQDLRGDWQIRGKLGEAVAEFSAQNLPGALNAADRFIIDNGGIRTLLKRDARWHDDKPTPKQLSLCRILRIEVPPGASKGMVSHAIDQKRAQMGVRHASPLS